jgi:protein-S-isoprenylcysteine O-methyltransferase Ste14
MTARRRPGAHIGSGNRILLFTLPFIVAGLALNQKFPAVFSVGGPPEFLKVVSVLLLTLGVVVWIWTRVLIFTGGPHAELITSGPYSFVKHPMYLSMAMLILPWSGFLLNSWLGLVIGAVFYAGTRMHAPQEEKALAQSFGPDWEEYINRVKIPWL